MSWSFIFSGEPPKVMVVRRGGITEIARISVIPPLLTLITLGGGGGSPEKIQTHDISQLRALANHRPIWGGGAQGALELLLPQIRKCNFLSDPCLFVYIF